MDRISTDNNLAALIDELCPREGSQATGIEGFFLTRSSSADIPRTSLQNAVFCVVAQGSKSILVDNRRLVYDSGHYLLVSLDLPLVGQMEEASATKPFLGVSLVLNLERIASLALEAELTASHPPFVPLNPMVVPMEDDLLDAVLRLTRLLRKPDQISILAPLILKEIYFKLLLGGQGGMLREMVATSGNSQRVAAGIAWIRKHFTLPIRMDDLAREMRMSPSAMYSCFRAFTSMSPLQYQKQLRLLEARRLMMAESLDAGSAGFRVGYASSSQFSREYRRLFGAPPMEDLIRLRKACA